MVSFKNLTNFLAGYAQNFVAYLRWSVFLAWKCINLDAAKKQQNVKKNIFSFARNCRQSQTIAAIKSANFSQFKNILIYANLGLAKGQLFHETSTSSHPCNHKPTAKSRNMKFKCFLVVIRAKARWRQRVKSSSNYLNTCRYSNFRFRHRHRRRHCPMLLKATLCLSLKTCHERCHRCWVKSFEVLAAKAPSS